MKTTCGLSGKDILHILLVLVYKLENCSIFVQALFTSYGPEMLAKFLYCTFYSNFSMMLQEKYDVSEDRALKLKTINSLERYFYL